MTNPWKSISLSDYENHMKLESINQLQTLNKMMSHQFGIAEFKSIIILGIAGGNGLEHINCNVCKKVYGVDVNEKYLKKCAERYPEMSGILECICADLTDTDIDLPSAELLTADLLIEYIGYKNFRSIIRKVKPSYISCIIQVNTDREFVSDSPYLHAFDSIAEVHHSIEENELSALLADEGFSLSDKYAETMPNGKKLLCLDYISA